MINMFPGEKGAVQWYSIFHQSSIFRSQDTWWGREAGSRYALDEIDYALS